jgi:hypothetical protein
VPIVQSVSARRTRVGAKTRSERVAEVYHQKIYLLASSCTYGVPPMRVVFEIVPRFVAIGMYYTEIELRWTTFDYNVQSYIHHMMIHTSNGSHPPPVPWESCQGCSSSHSEMRSASSTFFPESAKLLLFRKSWPHNSRQ